MIGAIGFAGGGGAGGGAGAPGATPTPGTDVPPVVTPTPTPGVTPTPTPTPSPGAGPVPEPSVWAMMIVGVGALGAAFRRRRRAAGTTPAGGSSFGFARRATLGGALWSGGAAVEAGDMAATVAVKTTMAGAAGKALLCVCPAAVVAGSVMTVPPLRQAVHAATATPAPAPVAAPIIAAPPPPCVEAVTVPVQALSIGGFPDTVQTAASPAPAKPVAAAPESTAETKA